MRGRMTEVIDMRSGTSERKGIVSKWVSSSDERQTNQARGCAASEQKVYEPFARRLRVSAARGDVRLKERVASDEGGRGSRRES